MAPAQEIKILLIFIGGLYVFYVAIILFLMLKPPKKMNSFYGYRSGNAARNQASWDYANNLAPKLMFLLLNISAALALTSVYFLKDKIPVDGLWLICVFLLCFLQILVIPIVETKLIRFQEKQKHQPEQ